MPTIKKLPKILEEDEVDKILNSFNTRYISGLRGAVITRIMLLAGLRISEALNLKLQDINFSKHIIHVINGKNSKDRNVPFGPELLYWLEKWNNKRPDTVKYKKSSYFSVQFQKDR